MSKVGRSNLQIKLVPVEHGAVRDKPSNEGNVLITNPPYFTEPLLESSHHAAFIALRIIILSFEFAFGGNKSPREKVVA